MNIDNDVWDKIVSEALELIDYLESMPSQQIIPAKQGILALAYTIVHLENSSSEIEQIIKSISKLENIVKISKNKIKKLK